MYHQTARFYDLVYGFKDYVAEAEMIRAIIRRECPHARSILDVGCGTAEHARLLSADYEVAGIDLEPEFVDIARHKVPSGTFRVADMRGFEMGRTYDVVQCLFSAIGYLRTTTEVVAALRCFRAHLAPGGLVLVEPWITPEKWAPKGPMLSPPVDLPDLKIVRMALSRREGDVTTVQFRYLVGTPEGIEHLEEEHVLTLRTVDEMLECFHAAGLRATHDPEGIFGRGLYVARA